MKLNKATYYYYCYYLGQSCYHVGVDVILEACVIIWARVCFHLGLVVIIWDWGCYHQGLGVISWEFGFYHRGLVVITVHVLIILDGSACFTFWANLLIK